MLIEDRSCWGLGWFVVISFGLGLGLFLFCDVEEVEDECVGAWCLVFQ